MEGREGQEAELRAWIRQQQGQGLQMSFRADTWDWREEEGEVGERETAEEGVKNLLCARLCLK